MIPCDGTLKDTLEKLAVLNQAGAHPSEIVGLSDSGDYLIAKQPWPYPCGDLKADRQIAVSEVRRIIPEFAMGKIQGITITQAASDASL